MGHIEIIGIIIGILGLTPILMDYEKYIEQGRILFSKDDLKYESFHITFDIESKEKIQVYQTGKIKVMKNNAKLILGHCNEFGTCENQIIKIDNLPIQNKYIKKDNNLNLMEYKIYNKSIGDKLVFEDKFTLTLDKTLDKINDDGLGTKLEFYKCQKLVLHIIYPKDFIPADLNFTESIINHGNQKINTLNHSVKQLACFKDNRKQMFWSIDYPKFKHHYNINWKWEPK